MVSGRPEREITWRINDKGCHIITSHRTNYIGYAQIKKNGVVYLAHRYVFEKTYGKLPKGVSVTHTCGDKSCINVSHLLLRKEGARVREITVMYNLLNIKTKLPDIKLRYLYLNEIWGINQSTIAELESKSQPYISRHIVAAKNTIPHQEFVDASEIQFDTEELKYIQMLPRDIIRDVQIIAFYENILGLRIEHPFFEHYNYKKNLRLAALSVMGIQGTFLSKLFNITQPNISIISRREKGFAMRLENSNRYDETADYIVSLPKRTNKFIIAGGN